MNDQLDPSLTGGGDSHSHYHSSDRIPTHDTLAQLQQLDTKRTVSTNPYTVAEADDILLCPSGGVINFPASKANGREIEVIMTGVASVFIDLAGSDRVFGEDSIWLTVQWTALRLKAVTGGWVII